MPAKGDPKKGSNMTQQQQPQQQPQGQQSAALAVDQCLALCNECCDSLKDCEGCEDQLSQCEDLKARCESAKTAQASGAQMGMDWFSFAIQAMQILQSIIEKFRNSSTRAAKKPE